MTFLKDETWNGQVFAGGWFTPEGGDAAVIEPATGRELGRIGIATPADVTRAVKRATEAQAAWAATPHTGRATRWYLSWGDAPRTPDVRQSASRISGNRKSPAPVCKSTQTDPLNGRVFHVVSTAAPGHSPVFGAAKPARRRPAALSAIGPAPSPAQAGFPGATAAPLRL